MVTQVASKKEAPFNFAKHIAKIRVRLNNHRGAFSRTIVNENMNLKGEKWISSPHNLTHRNPEYRVYRFFSPFKNVKVIQSVGL
ncbi:hypothetical protein ES703_91082 [subsurface metagenome]